jgi:hypothetical protein
MGSGGKAGKATMRSTGRRFRDRIGAMRFLPLCQSGARQIAGEW